MSFQLPLDFRLRDEATFARFVAGPNAELLDYLQRLSQPGESAFIYISGSSGSGKTHLLQATMRAEDESLYIPLTILETLSADMFSGVEARRLVCIDDIDRIAGKNDLEVALFSLMKQCKEMNHSMVLASTHSPDESGFELKDLISRLNGCMQYYLQMPDENNKREYIKQDAERRGLDFGDDVVDWMLTHLPRDMKSLSELMNRLDVESLRTQRRITIPFIKELV